jgi:hypothetical protein
MVFATTGDGSAMALELAKFRNKGREAELDANREGRDSIGRANDFAKWFIVVVRLFWIAFSKFLVNVDC